MLRKIIFLLLFLLAMPVLIILVTYHSNVNEKNYAENIKPRWVIENEDLVAFNKFMTDPHAARSKSRQFIFNTELLLGGKSDRVDILAKAYNYMLYGSESEFKRYLHTIFISIWIEHNLSEAEIATLFLEETVFNGVARGVNPASQHFFKEDYKDLNTNEKYVLMLIASRLHDKCSKNKILEILDKTTPTKKQIVNNLYNCISE